MTTDPREAIITDIMHATMPDGSPIRPKVKVDTILSQLGITDLPAPLVNLMVRGLGMRMRDGRRRASQEHQEPEAESDSVPEAMPQLHAITPPRSALPRIVSRPIVAPSRRELSPSSGPRLSRRDQERRDGPELVKHSRRTGGFPLKETVRITIRKPR